MKLLIIARVTHYQHEGRFYSYTPYARELDLWADLFSEVTVAGTLRTGPPPGDCTAFTRPNVRVCPIAEAGGDGLWAKFLQMIVLPKILYQLAVLILKADTIHVRCPCDLGLLGVLLAPLHSHHLIAKYATQWLSYKGEPWSWRLQRRLLRSWWWRGLVTVYGRWPNQPNKVIPFFTSMLTDAQLVRAQAAARSPRDPKVFRVLFVGRLSSAKNVDVLCEALTLVKAQPRKLECVIVGEGPQRDELEWHVAELGFVDNVIFTGGLGFDEVLKWYERADVLVLASDVEGWPKAIAEAMAFGAVCIGTARGMMPQMLGEGRGLLVPPRDVEALAGALQFLIDHPRQTAAMAANAAQWAQQYSLGGLRAALKQLMKERWHCQDDWTGMSAGGKTSFGVPH
jgi:glycosyltransferase involved in cell wall biosynthesis